jgi:hypothetical protein
VDCINIRTSSSWKAKLQANVIKTFKEGRLLRLAEEYKERHLTSLIVGRGRRQIQFHNAQNKPLPLFLLPVHVFLIATVISQQLTLITSILGRESGLAASLLLFSLNSLYIPSFSNSARATAQQEAVHVPPTQPPNPAVRFLHHLLHPPLLGKIISSTITSIHAAVSAAVHRSRTGPLRGRDHHPGSAVGAGVIAEQKPRVDARLAENVLAGQRPNLQVTVSRL